MPDSLTLLILPGYSTMLSSLTLLLLSGHNTMLSSLTLLVLPGYSTMPDSLTLLLLPDYSTMLSSLTLLLLPSYSTILSSLTLLLLPGHSTILSSLTLLLLPGHSTILSSLTLLLLPNCRTMLGSSCTARNLPWVVYQNWWQLGQEFHSYSASCLFKSFHVDKYQYLVVQQAEGYGYPSFPAAMNWWLPGWMLTTYKSRWCFIKEARSIMRYSFPAQLTIYSYWMIIQLSSTRNYLYYHPHNKYMVNCAVF